MYLILIFGWPRISSLSSNTITFLIFRAIINHVRTQTFMISAVAVTVIVSIVWIVFIRFLVPFIVKHSTTDWHNCYRACSLKETAKALLWWCLSVSICSLEKERRAFSWHACHCAQFIRKKQWKRCFDDVHLYFSLGHRSCWFYDM